MNDETIINNSIDEEKTLHGVDENQQNADKNQENDTKQPDANPKKKKSGVAAVLVGAAAFAGGILTPLEVFPKNTATTTPEAKESDEDNQNPEDMEGVDNPEADINIAAPVPSGHYIGHGMEVADNVNDTMSFNQAFAAARHEVGAGGIFVWHGHTYGTYYESEWNAMTAEEKEQYWADVHYTTTHLNETREPEFLPEPHISGDYIGHTMEIADNVDDTMSFNEAFAAARHEVGAGGLFVWHGHSYGTYYESEWNAMTAEEKGQYWADVHHTTEHINDIREMEPEPEPIAYEPEPEPTETEPELEPIAYKPEPKSTETEPEPEPGTLLIHEDDIIEVLDTNGDGVVDAAVIDANGNEIPDLVIDTDGDGTFDTLAVDVQMRADEVHEINDVIVLNDEPVIEPEPVIEENHTAFEEEPDIPTENPDIDLLADNTIDPNIPIDNGSDVTDFV